MILCSNSILSQETQEIGESENQPLYVKVLDAPFIYQNEYAANLLPREIILELQFNPFHFNLGEDDLLSVDYTTS